MAITSVGKKQLDFNLINGWIPALETWTYASANSITVPSDATTKYQKGDKIKLTQTSVKYFLITAVTGTTLTITGGTSYTLANAAITNNYYSHSDNPLGFPSQFTFTPVITLTGAGTVPVFNANQGWFSVSNRWVDYIVHFDADGGTDGAGAVGLLISLPVRAFAISTTTDIGPAAVYGSGGNALAFVYWYSATDVNLRNAITSEVPASWFSNGARWITFSCRYPME